MNQTIRSFVSTSYKEILSSANIGFDAFDFLPYDRQIKHVERGEKVTEAFTTKELGEEAGLDLNYFGDRYYDTDVGSWISIDPDGKYIIGTYDYKAVVVTLTDSDLNRGTKRFPAVSGHKKDPNTFGGPIPEGNYFILDLPSWSVKDPGTYLALFKDDGFINDIIDDSPGKGRQGFLLHRLIDGSDGCISYCKDASTWAKMPPQEWKKIFDWIKGTSPSSVTDSDGNTRKIYGDIEVVY